MQRMSVLIPVLLLVGGACTSLKPGYCKSNSDCPGGQHCNLDWPDKFKCTAATGDAGDAGGADGSRDAAPDGGDGSTGSAPDGSDAQLGCLGNQACPADQPICLSGTCAPCAAAPANACTQRDPSRPVCGGTGACVQCAASSDCSRDPNKPICVSGACSACGAGLLGECALRDPSHPVCGMAGACVACSSSSDCFTDPAKPICDLTTNACVACGSDAQCAAKGIGPGVCMAHQDGRCAADAETIYVENGAGCSDTSGLAGGTSVMPYCSMQPAVVNLDSLRTIIAIRGTVAASTIGVQTAGQVSIVGRDSAVIAGSVNPALRISAGNTYVRGIRLATAASIGCVADPGTTILMDAVTVAGNPGGGILLDGAAFNIANTAVTNNGPGDVMGTTWGGVRVQGLAASGPRKFSQVTIQNNAGPGISCTAAVAGMGVLATGNSAVDISPTCGFTSCMPAGAGCGATP